MSDVAGFGLYRDPLRTGVEKELLHAHLRLNRDVLVWKLEGLSEADRRRPLTPTGTNLIGLVKHMTGIECAYLCTAFGRDRPTLSWESDQDATYGEWSDMYAKPEETTDDLIADYRRACAAADLTIEELSLDTEGRHPAIGIVVHLRWMVLNVLQDTLRHAGQADIVRELIDGVVGHTRANPSVIQPDDAAHREKYLARVRGEIDTPSWFAYLRDRAAAQHAPSSATPDP